MTRVDFYVIGQAARGDADSVACRLAAKAFEQGRRVYVFAADEGAADRLDTLMWTFRDISFVPHKRTGDDRLPDTPVLIGTGDPPDGHADVMVNLSHPVPPAFSRFDRVIEIVPSAGEGRDRARERYRFYQDRGYALTTHELD
ncbi:MAG: DNA polymerase III subunit chi [Gammaproteobacteria bacterium]